MSQISGALKYVSFVSSDYRIIFIYMYFPALFSLFNLFSAYVYECNIPPSALNETYIQS